jgi:hypothetical protein
MREARAASPGGWSRPVGAWRCAAAATALISLGLRVDRAYALDKHACVAASDEGQALRLDGKLVEARARFMACADAACPPIVRTACADWLTEVDKVVPSVVLSVRDPSGQDIVDARVELDGQPLPEALQGRAVFIDPGPHTMRFSAPRMEPVTNPVVIREGEQRRSIDVVLETAAAAPPLPSRGPAPSAPSATPRSSPTAAWGFAIGAGLAWTAFGIFAVDGHVEYEDAKSCSMRCPANAYSPINTKFDVADVSLGLAVALTGVATVLFLTHHASSARATAAALAPLRVSF